MAEQTKVTTLEKVVIRFSGDSGDGMQLTGTIFSNPCKTRASASIPHLC